MSATIRVDRTLVLRAVCAAAVALLWPSAAMQARAAVVPLQNPTADHSQSGYSVANLLVPDTAGWASGTAYDPQTAVFETVTDAGTPGGWTELVFTLDHQAYNQHNLGRFRLSVTSDDRSQFADGHTGEQGVDVPGDVTANWHPVLPTSALSVGGATTTINFDGSVSLSGTNPANDMYVVHGLTNISGITGVRLEAMDDPPGRYPSNGNFVQTYFGVEEVAGVTPTSQQIRTHLINFNQQPASPAPSPYVPGADELLPASAVMNRVGNPDLVDTPTDGGVQPEGGGALQIVRAASAFEGYRITDATNLGGSYTAEILFQANALSGDLRDLINSEGSANTSSGVTILRLMNDGDVEYYPVYVSGSPSIDTGPSRDHVVAGQMQHLAVVYEKTASDAGTATLYLNGIPVGTVARSGITATGTFSGDFAVGTNYSHSNRSLDGYVDGFAISPFALEPGQFAYADRVMPGFDGAASDAGLVYHPTSGDLLEGSGVAVTSSLAINPVVGPLGVLTDGVATAGHPEMPTRTVAVDISSDWAITYDLGIGDFHAAIDEIRVFSQNTDGRVFQDYDVEYSEDGVNWAMLHADIASATRGQSVNTADGSDLYYDFQLTALRRLDGQPLTDTARYLRFTFRPVTAGGAGGLFVDLAGDPNYHTMLYEIDVFGAIVPEPSTFMLAGLGLVGLALAGRRRRRSGR